MSTDIHSPNSIDKIVEHISDLLRMLITREGSGAPLHGFVNVCLNLTNAFRDDLRTTCPLNVCLVSLMVGATSVTSEHHNLFSCCNQLLTDHTPCDGLRLWILGNPQNWSIPALQSNNLCTDYDYSVAPDNTNATIYCIHQPTKGWSEPWINTFTATLCVLLLIGISGHVLLTTIVLHYRRAWKRGNLLMLSILEVCDITAPLVLIPLAIIDLLSPAPDIKNRTCILEAMTYIVTILTSITILLLTTGSLLRVMQFSNKCLTVFRQPLSPAAITITAILTVTRVATSVNSIQCGENLSTETLIFFSTCGVLALLCCSYVLYYEAILSHCVPKTAHNLEKHPKQQTHEHTNCHNQTTTMKMPEQVPGAKAHLPPMASPTPQANGQEELMEKEVAELFSGPTIRTANTKVITPSPKLKQMLTNHTEHRLNNVLQIDDDSIVTDSSTMDIKQQPQGNTSGLSTAHTDLANTHIILAFIFTFAIGNLPPLLNNHIHTAHKDALGNNRNQYYTLLWCLSYAARCLNPWIVIAQHRSICKQLYKELRKLCQHRVRHHHDPS